MGLVVAQVTLPFFVLHGEADTVTDPEVSRALYDRAASADKTLKLYPGMWHGLTSGEPDGNVETVFADIVEWLDRRSDTRHPVPSKNAACSPVADSPTSDLGLLGDDTEPRRLPRQHVRSLFRWRRRTQHHSAM